MDYADVFGGASTFVIIDESIFEVAQIYSVGRWEVVVTDEEERTNILLVVEVV